MANPAEILSALPVLKWRGFVAPYRDVSFNWTNRLPSRSYSYTDVDGHDPTGRGSRVTTVELLFLNGLEDSSIVWYPDRWRQWEGNLKDGEPGDFEHPDQGKYRARVQNVNVTMSAGTRSGLTATVTFVETRERVDQPTVPQLPTVSVQQLATQVDADIADVQALYPTGSAAASLPAEQQAKAEVLNAKLDDAFDTLTINYPTGEGTTSIFDAVSSVFDSLTSFGASATARVATLAEQVQNIADALVEVDDPFIWQAVDNTNRLVTSIRQTGDAFSEQPRPTKRHVTTADTTLDDFAALVNNDIEDVIGLNLGYVGTPIISAGSTLLYY